MCIQCAAVCKSGCGEGKGLLAMGEELSKLLIFNWETFVSAVLCCWKACSTMHEEHEEKVKGSLQMLEWV